MGCEPLTYASLRALRAGEDSKSPIMLKAIAGTNIGGKKMAAANAPDDIPKATTEFWEELVNNY